MGANLGRDGAAGEEAEKEAMRRAAKVDTNQAAVVDALRRAGCSVQCLHTLGGGVPDLLVGREVPTGGPFGRERRTFLIEVKDGARPPSERKLTPDQVLWHREWRGHVAVAESVEDALRVVGLLP
jgi:hypothetical protein